MLACIPGENLGIVRMEKQEGFLDLFLEKGRQRITPVDERTVRVQYTKKEQFSESKKPGVLPQALYTDWDAAQEEGEIRVLLPKLTLVIDRQSNRYRYFDETGALLLAERAHYGKELEEFTLYRISEENLQKEYIDTPDGRKEVVREAARIPAGSAYHTRLSLEWDDREKEALYGLGQHEEGLANLRGNKVYLHQANRKIAVPMLVSTKGYGLLIDTYSPAIFNDTTEGSYFYTEADPEMDFYFMNGGDPDGVIRQYRKLTGEARLLPKWAYGYIQSQERYETQEEILDIAAQYRERGLGLDCIVLDWCSWEGNQWGQKKFDAGRFPDPKQMTQKLHENHVHFMLSIWPNMGEDTENYQEFAEKKQLLPGCAVYDALSPEARKTYWEQVQRELFCHDIDAWWCDSSEPFTPEWNHVFRPESAKLYEEYCKNAGNHLPLEFANAYGLYHAIGIYEGQREAQEKAGGAGKRVTNLTRSGYLGGQRYGTILWSGDIAATWETLRRQIAAGLQFCASGLPYWTVDIGAFFVRNGLQWFWKGDYDQGTRDLGYCELFTRWYQWGAFLPVFRGHGTEFRRELWKFDHEEASFYQAMVKMNRLRYELMPYIYAQAGAVWKDGALMMKPLAFGFPEDPISWNLSDQYLFGESLMVCPVTHPMYYGKGSEKLENTNFTREVYLPKGCKWYDFWTGAYYEGGQIITADAPLETIPLYVRAGSILPLAKAALSVEELGGVEVLRVYPGADAVLELYEDDGDGYAYEDGAYCITRYFWDDAAGVLTKGAPGGEPVTDIRIERIREEA